MIVKILKYHWGIIALILLMLESIVSNTNGSWNVFTTVDSFSVKYEYQYYDSPLKSILLILATTFLLYGGLANYKKMILYIPRKFLVLWGISLIIGFLFTVDAIMYYPEYSDTLSFASFFRYALNPFFFVYMLAISDGFNFRDIDILKKWSIYIGFIFIILAFISLIQIPDFLAVIGKSPVLVFMENAFWSFLAYALINCKQLKTVNFTCLLIGFVICAYLSVLLISRSWIIQSILAIILTVYYYVKEGKNNRLIMYSFLICFILMVPVFVALFSELPSYELLLNKMDQDTRSSQYVSVFNQIPMSVFLFGGGMYYTWVDEFNQPYRFIDNQTILLCYRYGIISVITYYSFILYPAVNLYLKNKYRNITLFIFIWCMAINGLSIFNSLNWDYMNLLLIIIAGYCWNLLRYENTSGIYR